MLCFTCLTSTSIFVSSYSFFYKYSLPLLFHSTLEKCIATSHMQRDVCVYVCAPFNSVCFQLVLGSQCDSTSHVYLCLSPSLSLSLSCYSLPLALRNSSLFSFFNNFTRSFSITPTLFPTLNLFFTFHFTFSFLASLSVPPSFLCIFTPPLTFSLLHSLSPPLSMPAISSIIFWLNTLLFACLFLVSIFLSPCQLHLPLVLIIFLPLFLSPASVSA